MKLRTWQMLERPLPVHSHRRWAFFIALCGVLVLAFVAQLSRAQPLTAKGQTVESPPETYTVNTTAAFGTGRCNLTECTFTEAIAAAEAHPGPDTVAFNIPGPGPHTILHLSTLTINGPITIDGYTQPGSHPATSSDPAQMDAQPQIVFDGSQISWIPNITPPHGFEICVGGADCVVQGLVFHSYRIPAIKMGSNTWLKGNFFGTDASGTVAMPSTGQGSGVIERSNGHLVGNLFGGNGIFGGQLEIRDNRFGIGLDGNPLPMAFVIAYAPGNAYPTIVGNYLANPTTGRFSVPGGYIAQNRFVNTSGGIRCGVDRKSVCIVEDNIVTGTGGNGIQVYLSNGTIVRRNTVTDNAGHGIVVNGVDTLSTQFNPQMLVTENVLRGNGGVGILQYGFTWPPTEGYDSIFMTARKNRIYENGGLGIDLSQAGPGSDGVTPNDPGDLDTTFTRLQNFPVLAHSGGNQVDTVVQGVLNTRANGTFTLDFYANRACDPSGYGEGERYVGSTVVTSDQQGNAAFTTNLPAGTAMFEALSATATDSDGATSEFSQCVTNAGIINGYLAQKSVIVDRSRLGAGVFVLHATFRNQSATPLTNGFFKVTRLAYQTGELEPAELVVNNAIGGPRGTGALVAIPAQVEPGATVEVTFELHLPRIEPFAFFVDGYGLTADLQAAVEEGTTNATPFAFTLTAADLSENDIISAPMMHTFYLPFITR